MYRKGERDLRSLTGMAMFDALFLTKWLDAANFVFVFFLFFLFASRNDDVVFPNDLCAFFFFSFLFMSARRVRETTVSEAAGNGGGE